MPKEKIAFIVNPVSGKAKHGSINRLLDKYLDESKYTYQTFFSDYQGHTKGLTSEAISRGFKIIIAVGGDGTVNEIFPQLLDKELIFGIIPLGSGNGLARFLDIPLSPIKSIKLINQLPIKKIDTAEINGHPFINISGTGFDAEVAKHFATVKKRGFWTYLSIVLKTYFSYKENEYQLQLNNGGKSKIKAFMVCFANSTQFGNDFFIAPKAKINDGLIDVCIVKKVPLWSLPITLLLVGLKHIEKSKYYKSYQVNRVYLRAKKEGAINIDGESVKVGNEIEVNTKPLSLNIICPKS